jgi:hypothetical protein
VTDSVYGKRVAPALALLLSGLLSSCASVGSDSLSGVTGRHFDAPGEFLDSLVAMTANLAFIDNRTSSSTGQGLCVRGAVVAGLMSMPGDPRARCQR